jgi:enoyl-CoA hydratase/carnithine racemase
MAWDHVTVERRDRVAVVRFDRGDRTNALSLKLMGELTEVAVSLEDDPGVSAVVLAGADTAFTAGMDLRDPAVAAARALPLGERRRFLAAGPKLCRAWERVEAVTIVAVEGFCIGGGVALAVACDFRVIAGNAHFRVPELELGMNMSWQSLPRLTRLVGPARAKRMVIMAEPVDAEAALDWGLADGVAVPGGAVVDAVAMAARVAAMPPVPVKMTKQSINAAANAINDAVSHMDRDQFALCLTGEDFAEGVAAFAEKRPPRFEGR